MLPPGNPPSSELGPGNCPAEVGVDPAGIPTAPIKEGYALPEHYFNRELSWIEFNARVLHEALDERTPLLERLKFLAIFESNLDEFFMVRVAVIRRQLETGVLLPTPDGLTPQQQLRQISQHLRPLIQKLHECFRQELVPKLAEQGIHIRNFSDLTEAERQELREYFDRRLFPLLTPWRWIRAILSPIFPTSALTWRWWCGIQKRARSILPASKCPTPCPALCPYGMG
jgi:polyphosphate kinase